MKRGILIGGTAIVSAIGSLMYSVGSFLPAALVGPAGSATLDPANFGPVNSGTGSSGATDPGTGAGTGSSGATFTGDAVSTRYGTVQVQISVSGSSITDIMVLQAPSGRNARWTNYAVPILVNEAMTAQSAEIASVSGASYTSYGFINSLASAISQM